MVGTKYLTLRNELDAEFNPTNQTVTYVFILKYKSLFIELKWNTRSGW